MTIPSKTHLPVIPSPAWGHCRPILHLCIQLLTIHPDLHVTFLLPPPAVKRSRAELASSSFKNLESSITDRFQIVDVTSANLRAGTRMDADIITTATDDFEKALPGYIPGLFDGSGVFKEGQENRFGGIVPRSVLFDPFQGNSPDAIEQALKQIGKPMVKLIAFAANTPAAWIHLFGPPEADGVLAHLQKVAEEAKGEDGKFPAELFDKIGYGDRGIIKKVPGMPDMTDFEYHPCQGSVPIPGAVFEHLIGIYRSIWDPRTVATVTTYSEELEEEGKAAVDKLFGKPFHMVGMQYPEHAWEGAIDTLDTAGPEDARVIRFLDESKEKHGSRSVVYVSFGSAMFPYARPSIAINLLKTLAESNTPFIFAHAANILPVPQQVIDLAKTLPNSLTVLTAPQMTVLHHEATSCFVSHCGGNSTNEAIITGTPIVGVPLAADQGACCEMLKKYGAAHDLKQVKCFMGDPDSFPKKTWDGVELIGTDEAMQKEMLELWARLKSGYSDEMRNNMRKLTVMCDKSRKVGKSRKEMEDLSQYF